MSDKRDDRPAPAQGSSSSASADSSATSNSAEKAHERLSQISSHLSTSSSSSSSSFSSSTQSNTSKRRTRRKSAADELPADYSDILGQVATLKKIANTPDLENRGYIRQKKAGKLWVRERVESFVDKGSLREVGSVSGTVEWKTIGPEREEPVKYVPSNNVQGFGKLRGRPIVFTADDYSIRAGHADGALAAKTQHMEELSLSMKLPMVKLVDGSSGGGSVTTIKTEGWSYLPVVKTFHTVSKALNGGIPNLGAVVGPAIGLGAARVTACHFSVMAGDIGSLFNAGPNVVAGKFMFEAYEYEDGI